MVYYYLQPHVLQHARPPCPSHLPEFAQAIYSGVYWFISVLLWQHVPCPTASFSGDQNWELLHCGISVPIRYTGLTWWLRWWRVCLQRGRLRFDPWVRKIPWRREWQAAPVFLPGKNSMEKYATWAFCCLCLLRIQWNSIAATPSCRYVPAHTQTPLHTHASSHMSFMFLYMLCPSDTYFTYIHSI